jgi:hypothetical protein
MCPLCAMAVPATLVGSSQLAVGRRARPPTVSS